jgi:hypothetical protein
VPSSLSGSGLARALACPAAYALPEAREGSSDATRGTQVHRFLELVSRGEPTSEHLAALDPALFRDPNASNSSGNSPRS